MVAGGPAGGALRIDTLRRSKEEIQEEEVFLSGGVACVSLFETR